MDAHQLLREALEVQIIEGDGRQAAALVERAILDVGAPTAGDAMLDTASEVLRIMVHDTEEVLVAPDLLSRLALDGAVPEEHLELLTDTLLMAAATAGGIRPSVEALITRVGVQEAMFGLWLALLTVLKVVAMVIDRTEVELVEEVLIRLEP